MGVSMELVENFQLNVRNIKKVQGASRRAFRAIRFDSNNNCNVHCVYCHNARSDELVDTEDFRAFLETSVTSVEEFQIGCTMEPTLDPRLCDFMEIVARSPIRPERRFRLQTNGILLHRHDASRMMAAGLSHLSISVDAAETSTHKDLRGGTSLAKVERNLRAFHSTCPGVQMIFLTTVTTANIAGLRDLIVWGRDVGVREFVFRQMYYLPDSTIVDHSRMPSLEVPAPEFAECRARLMAEFSSGIRMTFLEHSTLTAVLRRTIAISQTGPYAP